MTIEIEAYEVDQFEAAIAGLELNHVRTDEGIGPCRMTSAGSESAMVSAGSMGFSAITRTTIPEDSAVFLLVTAAPPGAAYCGMELQVGQLHYYAPGRSFIGLNPAGVSATTLVVSTSSLGGVAEQLGIDAPTKASPMDSLPGGPDVERLRTMLTELSVRPELFDDERNVERATECVAGALATGMPRRIRPAPTRVDSARIVSDAIEFVESTSTFQPTMGELCRAACASESRVRQAFVEVLDVAPTQYFRYRLLSRLREDLLAANPTVHSVTSIASSLGVTQLGRVAGRYRELYGELPSHTLKRRPQLAHSRNH